MATHIRSHHRKCNGCDNESWRYFSLSFHDFVLFLGLLVSSFLSISFSYKTAPPLSRSRENGRFLQLYIFLLVTYATSVRDTSGGGGGEGREVGWNAWKFQYRWERVRV